MSRKLSSVFGGGRGEKDPIVASNPGLTITKRNSLSLSRWRKDDSASWRCPREVNYGGIVGKAEVAPMSWERCRSRAVVTQSQGT